MIQETNNFINGDWRTLLFMGLSYLLGSFVTAFISHVLAKDKDRQLNRSIAFYNAAKNFRQSLHETLIEINRGKEHVYFLLHNSFDIHKLDAWEFGCVLNSTPNTKRKFLKAWEQYQDFYDTQHSENTDVTKLPDVSGEYILNSFEKHIKNLIEFTIHS